MQTLAIPDFFLQLVAYREYLKQSVLRDLRNKYKRSVLGYLWAMLHPLAMMAVLAVVFSNLVRISAKDYAVFLLAGLLPWNYFSSTVMMSLGSMRNNARLFSQIPVPKYLFIMSIALSNLFNLVVALIPLMFIMVLMGRPLAPSILAFPLVLLPLILVVLGLSLLLAASNVFFDDTAHLAEVGIGILYFLSPVLYSREHLPEGVLNYLVLNPLFYQIEFFRGLFYDGVLPDPTLFAINLFVSILVFAFGLFVFRSSEDKFLYFI